MRRFFFENDTYHHIILRGSRGMDIFPELSDWWHCLECLYYQNDDNRPRNWQRALAHLECERFQRPKHWGTQKPYVSIIAFCIQNNHLHLILKQVHDGGISNFMRRLPKNLTHRYNRKYGGTGSIFQGPYTARHIAFNSDLRNTALYVTVKNTMERYPEGGIDGARKNIDKAFHWATQDPFSSFPDFLQLRTSPIINKREILSLYPSQNHFKKEAADYLRAYKYPKVDHVLK